jgi:4a-hydroxytetrahydrobiopterin dehydratase
MTAKRELLSQEEIERRLGQPELENWQPGEGSLQRSFQFRDFVTAFGWMTSVALVAERINHHPDWKNVYRTVDVTLNTHDAGGVTDLDFRLAKAMNELAATHGESK